MFLRVDTKQLEALHCCFNLDQLLVQNREDSKYCPGNAHHFCCRWCWCTPKLESLSTSPARNADCVHRSKPAPTAIFIFVRHSQIWGEPVGFGIAKSDAQHLYSVSVSCIYICSCICKLVLLYVYQYLFQYSYLYQYFCICICILESGATSYVWNGKVESVAIDMRCHVGCGLDEVRMCRMNSA